MSHALQDRNTHVTLRASAMDPRILLLSLGMFALGTDALVVADVLPGIARENGGIGRCCRATRHGFYAKG